MAQWNEGKVTSVDDGKGNNVPPAGRDQQAKATNRLGNFGSGVDGSATDDTTGSSLPTNAVAPGVEVLVQAKPGNGSPIAVGLTSSPTVQVDPGQSITYRVQNTDQITIVAGTSGDGVNFTVEQEV